MSPFSSGCIVGIYPFEMRRRFGTGASIVISILFVFQAGCANTTLNPVGAQIDAVERVELTVNAGNDRYVITDEDLVSMVKETLKDLALAQSPASSMATPYRMTVTFHDGSQQTFPISEIQPFNANSVQGLPPERYYLRHFLINVNGVVYMGGTQRLVQVIQSNRVKLIQSNTEFNQNKIGNEGTTADETER